MIRGSPPTPNSEYSLVPPGRAVTSVTAGSRSALRYPQASSSASGLGRDTPVPPTTRPIPVSSQHSAPISPGVR